MTIIKPKSTIGGIEEMFSPETFFDLLGWTDRKYDNDIIRFKISDQQNYILERLGGGIYTGSFHNVARAATGLGILIESTQKNKQPEIVRGILRSTKLNNSTNENIEHIVDKMIGSLNFSLAAVKNELKSVLQSYGDNKLGKHIWETVKDEYSYGCQLNYQPKIKEIKTRVINIKWGIIPLDDEKRFKLHHSSENIMIVFRCSERLITLMESTKDEHSTFPKAKYTRGMFVKGLYVLAKWYQDNNKVVREWYEITRLLNELKLLRCKEY